MPRQKTVDKHSEAKYTEAMTRKDYIAIAAILKARRTLHASASGKTVDAIAKDLCSMLKADNPNFDRDRFLTACGVTV